MGCNAVNQCFGSTPLYSRNTPLLVGCGINTLACSANTHRCKLNTLVCYQNTPWAVTPLKPNTPRAFFFNSALPTTPRGHKYILVVTDLFSEWVEAFPLADSVTLAKILTDEDFGMVFPSHFSVTKVQIL